MRVLVAEDDNRTADYLVRGLTESGHMVDRVADGEVAMAMAVEGIYDALILDRKLPGMDGLTIVRNLRRRDRKTRSMLLEAAWTYDFEARGHIVGMHIHRLRQKIDDGFESRLIHTVAGAGYTVREPSSATGMPGAAE